ncbi:CLK4-associating serine/arginine rich protein-like [Oscarella lobularis]|uniref:CLK4-associating serine/arginine rich protein-like n=1 Tax=Oscarella lobularis TaxID=121494 RepID=UPI003313AD50
MWHEARKQEKSVRSVMIDYQKRAERRKAYYDGLARDPIQTLRIVGKSSPIHVNVDIAAAADETKTLIPWQGDSNNRMDKYDARHRLDRIESDFSYDEDDEESYEETLCNYERYKVLVQNHYLGVEEEEYLKGIDIDEMDGVPVRRRPDKEKKKLAATKAAIGYTYDEGGTTSAVAGTVSSEKRDSVSDNEGNNDDPDIKISALSKFQVDALDGIAKCYGITERKFSKLYKEEKSVAKELDELKSRGSKGRRDERRRRQRERSSLNYERREKRSRDTSSSSSDSSASPPRQSNQFVIEFGSSGSAKTQPSRRRQRTPSSSSYSSSSSSSSSSSRDSRRRRRRRSRSRSPQAKRKRSSSSKTTSSKPKLTPQERLKRRMQLMLNKQLKSDKSREVAKEKQKERERQEREEGLKELCRRYDS